MIFTAKNADGEKVEYKDNKRWLWWMTLLSTIIPFGSMFGYMVMAPIWGVWANILLFGTLVYYFGIIPSLDKSLGEDPHNPPDEVMDAMAKDKFYTWAIMAHVPLLYIYFFFTAWFVSTQGLAWWGYLGIAVGMGYYAQGALNLAHELGHKPDKINQFAAKISMWAIGYAHFCIEHNRGHHVAVSTPEDPASSRMGENFYSFTARELYGTFKRGWMHETKRLSKKGHGAWSMHNEILQGYAFTTLFSVATIAYFGWIVLPFILIHHIFGCLGLSMANYIEHYGLKRKKLENGRYEPCQPHHSWNTNHIFSNILTFHLQRHSDHHANPMRPYQILRNFDHLPTLPSGYPGCYGLCIFPSLWFKVMDPKVIEWVNTWEDGDMDCINYHPAKEAELRAKWGGQAITGKSVPVPENGIDAEAVMAE